MCAIATEYPVVEVWLLLRAGPDGVQQWPPEECTKENDDKPNAGAYEELPSSIGAWWNLNIIVKSTFVSGQKACAFLVAVRG